ncbi:MAG: nucleotidyltransferase family protein [Puia sp.]|nr:nucleotidyltransferase family protein [Puia sp.]
MSAIVLAAGMSQRMGKENKLLLPFAGKTLLETTIGNILRAEPRPEVIVVTGHEADRVKAAIQHLPVTILHNPGYATGMTGSIQAGVRRAMGDGFMICLGDMPLISAAEYSSLMESFEKQLALDPQCICIPVYRQQPGNPVIFSAWYRDAILSHTAPEGCREIVRAHRDFVLRVPMPADSILRDIDQEDDYIRITHLT